MRGSGKKPAGRTKRRPMKAGSAPPWGATEDKKGTRSRKTERRVTPSGTHRLQDPSSLAKKETASRVKRVEKVKAQIAQGTYQVNSEAVARAIVRREVARLLNEEPGGKNRKS